MRCYLVFKLVIMSWWVSSVGLVCCVKLISLDVG